jgi:hypothetical protein
MYCTDINEFHVIEHITVGSLLPVSDSHWQKILQAAVNKMIYTTEQGVFCVKRFYQTDSVIIGQHVFQMRFDCREVHL